ncbi:MAG TPA: hypothetical protein PLL54_00175 [Dermatophilaceae bacterium]|nr:hypothetical protein [Dermatophilaceae bacterium]
MADVPIAAASYQLPAGEVWPTPSRWRFILGLVGVGLLLVVLTLVILHWTGAMPYWPWEHHEAAATTATALTS